MCERKMDGALFMASLRCGQRNLKADVVRVNELNVFPIPDGDTGDNMYATLMSGVRAAGQAGAQTLGEAAAAAERGMLLGARGNSGVILSQMFAGIAHALRGKGSADTAAVADAFLAGSKCAYEAVAEPVEGTMLTVMREAAVQAASEAEKGVGLEPFFEAYVRAAEASLERTPSLLPVLREAGVIDSGGAGLLCIARGFLEAARGEDASAPQAGAAAREEAAAADARTAPPDLSAFDENSVMEFGYCTEFLLQLTRAKGDVSAFSLGAFKEWLAGRGDSIVAVRTGTVVKVHVHTMQPGPVLEYAQTFGEFLTVKIENMTLQHHETLRQPPEEEFTRSTVRKPFAAVALASGEGFRSVFKSLGADAVIGEENGAPQVEAFVKAYEAVNADHIFVFPNNANYRLAAEEAAKLCRGSDVRIIPAGDLGEGYAALAALDYSAGDADAAEQACRSELKNSASLLVTHAVRDARLYGVSVRKGEYFGFSGKRILAAAQDKTDAALAAMEELGARERGFIVVFYGAGMAEKERARFAERVKQAYPSAEYYEAEGGQAVYDLVIVLQ